MCIFITRLFAKNHVIGVCFCSDSFLKEGNVRKIVIDHSENSNESSDSREGSNDGNINYLISSADGHKLVTQAICVLLDKRNYVSCSSI